MSFQPKPCKWCGLSNHTSFTCRHKQRKGLHATAKINKHGKVAKQWAVTRTTWFRKFPPPPGRQYCCYICGIPVGLTPELDHIASRTRHPELRFDLNNLLPICHLDNQAKGSRDLNHYLANRPALLRMHSPNTVE